MVPLAGSAALASGRGLATGAGVPALASAGLVSAGLASAGLVSAGLLGGPSVSAGFAAGALAVVEPGEPLAEAGAGVGAGFVAAGAACDPLPGGEALKYATQTGSTLWGSRWYWSNISSTSHSLAPRSLEGWPRDWSDWLPEGCGTAGFASSSDACE